VLERDSVDGGQLQLWCRGRCGRGDGVSEALFLLRETSGLLLLLVGERVLTLERQQLLVVRAGVVVGVGLHKTT
jgi:hypothetical protein